jgi:hypothetical protein
MSKKLSGSCLCGALRYESSAEPLFQGFCQCSDCNKAGTGHYAAIGLPEDAVTITGEYTAYGKPGDSGKMIYRHFCPTCGGLVFDKGEAFAGVMIVNASLLDDPSLYQPQSVIYTRSALPWDHVDPSLPKFEGMPPTE